MSADEIMRLAESIRRYREMGSPLWSFGPIADDSVKAIVSYAEMVKRCDERIAHYSREVEDCGQSCVEMGREEMTNRIMRSELNYVLKGETK